MTRTLERTAPQSAFVRPLLYRRGIYTVPTATFTGFVASQIVREQFKHDVVRTVTWSMAMFDVTPASGGAATKSIDAIAQEIDDRLEVIVGDADLTLKPVVEVVHAALLPIYGNQMRVVGWMPGHRVAEGGVALEISGRPCPSCTVNPTAYRVGDTANTERCLNSEDCGWRAA